MSPATSDPGGRELRLAPSILSADFARLADEVASVEGVADLLHVDVMDGHYVPNLTLGPVVVEWLRRATTIPFDVHLMITDPRAYGPRFAAAGAESVTFHPATDPDPLAVVDAIHDAGAEAGIAIRPSERIEDFAHLLHAVELVLCMTVEPGFAGQAFLPEGLVNVEKAVALRHEHGHRYAIEVDGGIKPSTVGDCVRAGADTLVAGSAVFDQPDRRAAARAIVEAARRAWADER